MDQLSKNLIMSLLRGDRTFEETKKALADPSAHKLSTKIANGSASYRWWGKVKTSRMTVAYCRSCHRNVAGYFIGWREVYDKDGNQKRDNYVARKSKKRLSQLQLRRTQALLDAGAKRIGI